MLYVIGGAFYSYPSKYAAAEVYHEKANDQYTPYGYEAAPSDQQPEPFLTILVVAAVSGASSAFMGLGLAVYFKKRKR